MVHIYSVIFIALANCSCKKSDYQKEFDNPFVFSEAAEEISWSRFHGGIRFYNSCIVSKMYWETLGDSII